MHAGHLDRRCPGDHARPGRPIDRTLPAIFIVMTFMMWNWWSVYLSGELKSAMNRRRQMTIMFGALAWDVIFIAIGAALLFKVTGFDFVVAANTPESGYAIPAWRVLPVPRRAGLQHPDPDRPHRRLVPVLEPARDGRQHVHAHPDRVRVGVRPPPSREAGRSQRADPFAGPCDPARHGHRDRHAGVERLVDGLQHVARARRPRRCRLRRDRRRRRHSRSRSADRTSTRPRPQT